MNDRRHLLVLPDHRQEVGYVLLEECEIDVIEFDTDRSQVGVDVTTTSRFNRHEKTAFQTDHHRGDFHPKHDKNIVNHTDNRIPSGKWLHVAIRTPTPPFASQKHSHAPSIIDGLSCATSLILRLIREEGGHLSLETIGKIPPFRGLVSEIFASTPSTKQSSANDSSAEGNKLTTGRRSDASLLAGLAMEINQRIPDVYNECTFSNIRMESAQIMILDDDDPTIQCTSTTTYATNKNIYETPAKLTRVKASFLMTFSLPVHRAQTGLEFQQSSKMGNLPSIYQLLGSIISCDWGYLEGRLKNRRHHASNNDVEHVTRTTNQLSYANIEPFFPSSLTVEKLYNRLSGATLPLGQFSSIDLTNDMSFPNAVEILDIPDEIITTSIATYLRARSLYSLRVTSRRMYHVLRKVVPGLKLKLFQHQISSLEWMELRERNCIIEEDLLKETCPNLASFVSYDPLVKDYHRAITGGATVLLRPRPNEEKKSEAHPLMRFDSRSGDMLMTKCGGKERNLLARKVARGGLLCDDPGLGKTITIISLILRTFGLRVEVKDKIRMPSSHAANPCDDSSLFYSYWHSDFLTCHVRIPAIMKLISDVLKSDRESWYFLPPLQTYLEQCPDYLDVIEKPISFQEIRKKYSVSNEKDFQVFEEDVRLCFRNAIKYNPPSHDVHQAALRLRTNFEKILVEFKRKHVKTALKALPRMIKQGSASELVDKLLSRKSIDYQNCLIPSYSTLIVVPNPLLHYWEKQFTSKVDFRYCKSTRAWPLFYFHTSKCQTIGTCHNMSYNLQHFNGQDHPLLFIDDGSKELPPANVLSRFHIVLTSYNRFTSEWKFGSVDQEIKASKRCHDDYWESEPTAEASALLKVHWLRLIVDEGHVMGKNSTNAIQFASWISAQRRWVMTGTPTQQVSTQNGLRQLFHLLNFLKHNFFCKQLGKEQAWNDLINKNWKEGNLTSFFRLSHLLSFLMIRHAKSSLAAIPTPIMLTTYIELSQSEIAAYNTVVSGIRANIITTSMEGKTSGWQDSLLNPTQTKYASEALTNLRIACCGGCQIRPSITSKAWSETLRILRHVHNIDNVKIQVVNNFIHRATSGELSSCMRCGIQLLTLLVIPCGDLICTECIDNRSKSCPVCDKKFDVDDFQLLQPGFQLQYRPNLKEETEERVRKQMLNRALLDSVMQHPDRNEQIDLEGNDSVLAEDSSPAKSHKRGESCVYSSQYGDGKCIICKEEHYECNFLLKQQCTICYKRAEDCPEYATKAKYVINKLLQLQNDANVTVSDLSARVFAKQETHEVKRPLKAVAFSQFRTIYEYFGDRLIRRFGGACVADFSYSKTRSQELEKFINNSNCFIMLLSKEGSHGLDLSFVTNIFFLDTIYDKSLESQVIARAYRMGALGPVHIEQLSAKETIEEVMDRLNGYNVSRNHHETHAKMHTLLKSATLIRPHTDEDRDNRKRKGVIMLQRVGKRKEVRFL